MDEFELGPTVDLRKVSMRIATAILGQQVFQALMGAQALTYGSYPNGGNAIRTRVSSVNRNNRTVTIQWEDVDEPPKLP